MENKLEMDFNCQLSIVNLLLLLPGCYDDRTEAETLGNKAAIDVAMTIDLPGDVQYQSGTKAMTADEEQKVDHIHILAFVYDGTDYIYDYTAEGTALNPSGNQITFKARLKTYPMQQRFMIIANAKTEIEAAILYGKTPAGVQQLLITRQSTEWPARNTVSGPVRSIPMYTLTPAATVTTTTTTLGSYGILRMLARIDIKKNAAVANFRLTFASLFNRKDRGYISFNESDWDNAAKKVTAPAIPTGTTTTKLPIATYAADSESFLRSIYTFEAEGTTDRKDATAIVIGGYFGYPANTTKETYYRIDIPAYDAANNALPNTMGDILRNHLYEIEIKGVSQEGTPTAEEAFDGDVILDATIKPWNLAKNSVIFDGQYTFSINHNRLVYDKDAATYPVEVSTDHPDGITVGTPSDSWFTVTGLAPGSPTGTLSAAATGNTTGAARSATVTLTVGGTGTELEYTLTATQSETGWLEWTNHQIYYTNGKAYTTVNGNAAKITSVSDWSAMVTNAGTLFASQTFTNGGTGTGTPVDYPFTLKDNGDSDLYHIAEITFKDLSGTFPDKTYPVVNMEGSSNNVANSIIVTGTGAVTIPSAYRKAYAIWRCGDGKSGSLGDISTMGALDANVVWQDVNMMITDNNVSFNSSTGAITIASTSATVGNAVVALQAGGVNVWSWHIWKPSTAPTDLNGWMNMNLGAMNATPGNSGSMGLLYQWGRKDPFLASNAFNINVSKVSYNGAAGTVHAADNQGSPSERVSVLNNLENSIRNPFTFYTGNGQSEDWYTTVLGAGSTNSELNTVEYANQNNYLWNSRLGDKTPFDPCPARYRVPAWTSNTTVSPWNGLTIFNFPWANYGRTANSHGGYYPAGGARTASGALTNTGIAAHYLTGSINRNGRQALSQLVHKNNTQETAIMLPSGSSVRCLKGD